MRSIKGKKNWIFADGELPAKGEKEPFGHESLMVTNLNTKRAVLNLDILFEDRPPVKNVTQTLEGERVICIRLDKPIGDQMYMIPKGQYAIVLHSNVPVAAVFGRLDVTQPNMSFYSVQGYSY